MSDSRIPDDTYKAVPNDKIGKRVLILTDDKTEDLEFFYPYYRFTEEGYFVDVVTPSGGKFEAKHGLGISETKKIAEVNPDDYELLYIPGGKAPAKLMKDEAALELTRRFVASGKPVSSICHGPQVLAAAQVINGKKIAAWPEVEDEVEGAGATYVNEETVIDGQFVTGRWPADLPSLMESTMSMLNRNAFPPQI